MSKDMDILVKEFSRTGLSEVEVCELEQELQDFRKKGPLTHNVQEALNRLTPTQAENQPGVDEILKSVCLLHANATANDSGWNGTGFLAKMKLRGREYIGFFTAGHCMPADLSQLDTIDLHFRKIEPPGVSLKLTEFMAKEHVLVSAHKGIKTTMQNFAGETRKSCHPDLDFCAVLFTESVESASAFLKNKGLFFMTVAEPGACGPSPGSPVTLWGFPSYKPDCPIKLRALSGVEAKVKPGMIPDIAYAMETEHGASGSLVFNYAQRVLAVHTSGNVRSENSGYVSGGASFDTIRAELVRENNMIVTVHLISIFS